ncbi:MAG TPA: hypothetical protein PLY21_14165 [Spirochaetota bacterium]|nr:hypothetical protein [Spirochaetota bacterium]
MMSSSGEEGKCIFLINTEFVLLVSLLYAKYFLDKKLQPVFVLIRTTTRRFSKVDISKIPGVVYLYINELSSSKLRPDTSYLKVRDIKRVKQILFQNPEDMINSSLVAFFRKANPDLKLIVVSDSIAIERKVMNKPRDRFIHYARLGFRRCINRLPDISWKVWSYHTLPFEPDGLIAHRNYNFRNFINTKDLFGLVGDYLSELSDIFVLDTDKYKNAEIIFFTQPNLDYTTFSSDIKRGYYDGVRLLSSLALENKVYTVIKVHPAENPEIYMPFINEFTSVDSNSNTPAEIIINGLEGKKIVSYWSSISVYDIFNNHKHFWLYKTINYKLPAASVNENIFIIEDIQGIKSNLFNR